MGRLFWKFFFVFWLTVVCAGLGVGVVMWMHQRAQSEHNAYVAAGGPPAFITQTAAEVLKNAGLAPLRKLLGQWHEPVPLYVVGPDGKELRGRAVSEKVLAAARAMAHGSDPRPGAREVTLADGRQFLLFVPAREHGAFRPPPPRPEHGGPREHRGPPPPPWLPIGAGIAASILFSAFLAWYMSRPIRHLRRAFASAAEGDLEVRVRPLMGRRRDEIADLGRDFDHMAAQLHELIGAQRRLFHDVSHELRSPLARLQAAVGLLQQDDRKTAEAVARVELEAGRLDTLVGELLLLARLESGVPGAHPGEVDLVDLVESIVDDARFEAEASGCAVSFEADGPMIFTGRADLLGRAVENVVRNAVKYTTPGSTVAVTLRRNPAQQRFELTVDDCGPGISDSPDAIFEPFYRGRGSGGQGGYGLGLAIARRAVWAHGGQIGATNRSNGGLSVHIVLPIDRSDTA